MAFKTLSKRLDRHGESAVKRLAYSLKINEGSASGRLEESIDHRIRIDGSKLVFTISMEDYWEYASFGRKAGTPPPVDKIKEWLTYPNVKSKIGNSKDFSSTDIDATTRLAYAIQNKIAKEGTEGSHFTDVVFENKQYQQEELDVIEDSFNEDLETLLDETMVTTALKTVELGNSGVKVTIKDI